MRKIVSLAIALLVLPAFLGFTGGTAFAEHLTTIHALSEQNNSGQSGTATFAISDDESTLTVTINISGGSSMPQPAHIHIGTCDNLDPKPFLPLNSVVNGTSVTVITDADLADLDYEVSNQFSVNVHKSATEASVYVACGELVPGGNVSAGGAGAVGMPRTGSGDFNVPLVATMLLALFSLAAGLVVSYSQRKI